MVIGFDVSHDPDQRKKSVASVVATLDRNMSRYFSICEKQLTHTELVSVLEISVLKALEKYRGENGVLPDRVVVFRDGVGDGRFNYTLEYEVPQIQRAFTKVSPEYKPKLSFVIVSKRIMVRLTRPHPGVSVKPSDFYGHLLYVTSNLL